MAHHTQPNQLSDWSSLFYQEVEQVEGGGEQMAGLVKLEIQMKD